MYFRHLELRGSCFNKRLQETGFERHLKAPDGILDHKEGFQDMLSKGCRLKRACKRTGPELRRFARLSVQCTLKRAFISSEVQKSHFWCKSLNSKHPKVPIASRDTYKQYRLIAWQ